MSRLVVVTATTQFEKAASCIESWGKDVPVVIVANSGKVPHGALKPPLSTWLVYDEYMGTVPAFKAGVDFVLDQMPDVDIIACLHDDVVLYEPEWMLKVRRHFDTHPRRASLASAGRSASRTRTSTRHPTSRCSSRGRASAAI